MKQLICGAVLALLAASPVLAQTSTSGGDPVEFPGGDRDNGLHASTLLQMGISPRAGALARPGGRGARPDDESREHGRERSLHVSQ